MINSSELNFFFATLNTIANSIYNEVPNKSQVFSSDVPLSDAETWKTGWIGLMDKMRPWDGPRVTKEPSPQTYSVTPYPFEQTRALDRFRFDDDAYGIFSPIIERMARQAKRARDFETRDLLQNKGKWTGAYQNGWDGLSYFNTAHPVDFYDTSKGTYTNDFTGGGSTQNGILVGGVLSQTSILTLWEYMTSIKGEDGEPLEVEATDLLVPSTLKGEAEMLLKNAFMAPPSWATLGAGTGPLGAQVGAADNVLTRWGLKYTDWALLNAGSATTWYMQANNHVWKPMLWILRQAPVIAYLIKETDIPVFMNHEYVWGMFARWAPAWAPSWLMARSGP